MVSAKSSCFAAATALFHLATPLSAIAVKPRAGPVNYWVTIDPSGSAQTIYPVVTTVAGGSLSIVSAPPYSLTGTVFTTTNANGQKTTSTGPAPPPQATNANGAGYFAVCNNAIGMDGPFCQPSRGSQLRAGRTYYVTWDSTLFWQDEILVQVNGFEVSPTTGQTLNQSKIFGTGALLGKSGYYIWTIPRDLVKPGSYMNMSLTISSPQYPSGEEEVRIGPTVSILEPVDDPAPSNNGPNKLAIALPIVFVLLGLLGVAGFWWYRRRGGSGMPSLGIKRSSSGYGVRQAHSERVGGSHKGGVDIQLGERSPTSPTTPGRNVFQEEVARQERERH